MAARFLLGSFEACVAPTFIAIVQMWYRRGEQTVRNAAWYAQLGVVNIVSLQGLSVYMYTVTDLYRAARKSSQLRVSPHCIKHPLPVPDHLSFLRSAHRYAELHSLQQHQSTDTPHSPLLSRSIHLAPRLTNASSLLGPGDGTTSGSVYSTPKPGSGQPCSQPCPFPQGASRPSAHSASFRADIPLIL
jgi:hypothetical protein